MRISTGGFCLTPESFCALRHSCSKNQTSCGGRRPPRSCRWRSVRSRSAEGAAHVTETHERQRLQYRCARLRSPVRADGTFVDRECPVEEGRLYPEVSLVRRFGDQ